MEPQLVPAGNVAYVELLDYPGGDGALAGAGGPQDHGPEGGSTGPCPRQRYHSGLLVATSLGLADDVRSVHEVTIN